MNFIISMLPKAAGVRWDAINLFNFFSTQETSLRDVFLSQAILCVPAGRLLSSKKIPFKPFHRNVCCSR
jgi:hypothetical protein